MPSYLSFARFYDGLMQDACYEKRCDYILKLAESFGHDMGITLDLACGTGTCATVVAAILNGLADNDVTVHLLGGDLEISWSGNENDSVFMTGPATYVFTGEIDI